MSFWQQLLALILTPTLAVGALAWIIRRLFDRGLQREIERFKSQLEIERFEHQTKFSIIHEKRAEIIAGTYGGIVRTMTLLADLVSMLQPGGQKLPEKKKRVAEAYQDAYSFFSEHRL